MVRALLVIDVQKDFCEGGSVPVPGGAGRAAAIAGLVARTAAEGVYAEIVATRDHHIDPGGHFSVRPDFRASFPAHCVAGTEGAAFHPYFAAAAESAAVGEVFYKGEHAASESGFDGVNAAGTRLTDWLRARGVTSVDVVGIATDHCVRATALDAVRDGFATRVLLDYTAGVARETTDRALEELGNAGVSLDGEPVVQV